MSERSFLPKSTKETVAFGATAVAIGGLALAGRKINRLKTALRDAEIDRLTEKFKASYWEKEAKTDPKTGLLNDRGFREELGKKLKGNHPVGLILIDMNAFKALNDTLGHDEGDNVLKRYGSHMRKQLHRKDDSLGIVKGTAARHGGDEFAVVVDLSAEQDNHRLVDPSTALEAATHYIRLAGKDFVTEEASLNPRLADVGFGFAIGGAVWNPGEDPDPTKLYVAADLAMYEDKQQQKGAR